MKLRSLLVAVALVASLQSVAILAHIKTNTGPIAITNLASAPKDWPNQRANPNPFITPDGELRSHNLKTGEQTASPSLPLTPGAYKTAPYACIVVVPSRNLDDRSVIVPAECDSRMPVINLVELRFIPLRSKQMNDTR